MSASLFSFNFFLCFYSRNPNFFKIHLRFWVFNSLLFKFSNEKTLIVAKMKVLTWSSRFFYRKKVIEIL